MAYLFILERTQSHVLHTRLYNLGIVDVDFFPSSLQTVPSMITHHKVDPFQNLAQNVPVVFSFVTLDFMQTAVRCPSYPDPRLLEPNTVYLINGHVLKWRESSARA